MTETRALINDYLDDPTPAGQRALTSRRDAVVQPGLEAIVERLQVLAKSTFVEGLIDPQATDAMIQMTGVGWVAAFHDVLVQIGPGAIDRLIDLLQHPSADVATLAALNLGIGELDQSRAREPLQAAFRRGTRSSGLRLATAIALADQGDYEALLEMKRFASKTNITDFSTVVPRAVHLVIWGIATEGLGPADLFSDWVHE